ncbi:MAG: hypothetical protein NZ921_00360 [Candidatus Caldarchaeum sp.]|nr:hypothetical protein [Candidatus Caldarchaeum sp.]
MVEFLRNASMDGLLSLFPTSFGPMAFVLLVVVALALIFFGRKLAKFLAFLAAGAATALLAATYLPQYVGQPLTPVVALVGFVVGGLIGLFVLRLGMGLAFGILGYNFAVGLGSDFIIGVVAGLALFIVGVFLSDKIISGITALLGGLLLVQLVTALGAPLLLSIPLAAVLVVAGFFVQTRQK